MSYISNTNSSCLVVAFWNTQEKFRGDAGDQQESMSDGLTIFIMAMEEDTALYCQHWLIIFCIIAFT